jgi:hypothetical protein
MVNFNTERIATTTQTMAAAITNQINVIIASVLSSPLGTSLTPSPISRPDTLKGVDDLIRAGFEAYRGSCFNWLLAATGLVVAGLVFEGPELWHDITSIVRHWRFVRRFHFAVPEVHTPDWAKLFASLGWLLIVVGVAGEYVADSFVSKADGYVQTFDELLLTEAQRGTAFARERASAAYERASENEKETANTLKQVEQERADAAKSLAAAETARKEAEGFQLQIAHANERASNAEKVAAQSRKEAEAEHLARVELEQKLSWRTLSAEQGNRVATTLLPFAGQQFDFETYSSEAECLNFENELYRVVLSGRWALDPNRKWSMLINLVVGIEVNVAESATKSSQDAATALTDALNAEGILAVHKAIPAKDGPNPSIIVIIVGKSPASMQPINPQP